MPPENSIATSTPGVSFTPSCASPEHVRVIACKVAEGDSPGFMRRMAFSGGTAIGHAPQTPRGRGKSGPSGGLCQGAWCMRPASWAVAIAPGLMTAARAVVWGTEWRCGVLGLSFPVLNRLRFRPLQRRNRPASSTPPSAPGGCGARWPRDRANRSRGHMMRVATPIRPRPGRGGGSHRCRSLACAVRSRPSHGTPFPAYPWRPAEGGGQPHILLARQ